ncbi:MULTISPECIES: hypothetical protein [unclassified Cupriavidus]|uniref:hypothetical protein n=1 Tax=unclassified Cupriavidus TaxID=2640874 RepID=UPI00088D208D|nr:hypothetical protein [Cupriavidus sp. YR651]SDD23867.1 hypothetical protein SAMN05216345_10791 [Cupriavidus sp. YR651]
MAYSSEWKKRVFETHEVQVLVKPRSPIEWEYTVRVCRPGTNIRAYGTLVETSPPTDHFKTPEDAEAAGFARGKVLAAQLL